jgi:hypothetical protein
MNKKQTTKAAEGIPIKTIPCTLDQITRHIKEQAAERWLLQQHIRLYANDILLVFVQQ